MRRRIDGPNLPGIAAPAGEPRVDRFGRLRGPWKPPARYPCDFKRANGCVCDLESVTAWCRNPGPGNPGGAWHRHAPGAACGTDPIRNRCALHPIVEGL